MNIKSHTKNVFVVVGMAGTGKTTLIHAFQKECTVIGKKLYIINLDPAVYDTKYSPNVDIRDTIDYSQVMQNYEMGPNGAIMTCLNLFATKADRFIQLIGENYAEYDYFIIDTPGQIEAFTWSASSTIICESIAAQYPLSILYTVDSQMCLNVNTFVSNMMYSISQYYRSQLPMAIIFNKYDLITEADKIKLEKWLTDHDSFQDDLDLINSESKYSTDYYLNLTRDLSFYLSDFYSVLDYKFVSSLNGTGVFEVIDEIGKGLVDEWREDYLEELLKKRQSRGKVKDFVDDYQSQDYVESEMEDVQKYHTRMQEDLDLKFGKQDQK